MRKPLALPSIASQIREPDTPEFRSTPEIFTTLSGSPPAATREVTSWIEGLLRQQIAAPSGSCRKFLHLDRIDPRLWVT
jgi:hypothetical protein